MEVVWDLCKHIPRKCRLITGLAYSIQACPFIQWPIANVQQLKKCIKIINKDNLIEKEKATLFYKHNK